MQLRGREFGNAFCAAGARNFFGEGYWFHSLLPLRFLYWLVSLVLRRPWGLNYEGSTLVAKTTTVDKRPGNMDLKPGTVEPAKRFPNCIVVNWWGGYALNKVGLSGPGAWWLLQQGLWQKRQEPFIISFMAVSQTSKEERLEELRRFVMMLVVAFAADEGFRSRVALEINLSCPNAGLDQGKLIEEAREMREIFEVLGIPVGFKLSVDTDPRIAAEIAKLVDFLTVTNTIPFGKMAYAINWKQLFGSDESPLKDVGQPGGGGLSGAPLLPLVVSWIREIRKLGVTTPIIGGGGILTASDAEAVLRAGANAVFLGCVSMLRPWRVASIIRYVNALFSRGFVGGGAA
jgi:dihydroorotate dehydrogenase